MSHRRVCLLLLAGVAMVPGSASSSRASLLRAMGLGELVNAADIIVVGSVASVHAAWDVQHRRITSTIEIDIEESWKGPAAVSRRLSIVQPGGSVGDIEMTVQGMPSFSTGEKSVLFLQGQRRFHVVGMGQGKRALLWNDPSKQWLAESPDTEGVVEVGPGAKLRQARRVGPIPLDDLREQVRRALGNSP
jgi:hypothetical protein